MTEYTALLETLEKEAKPYVAGGLAAQIFTDKNRAFSFECYSHPKRAFYIGVKVTEVIFAPSDAVEKVVADPDKYTDTFFAFDEVKKTASEANGFTVFWKHPIPVPFIPDLRYETVYKVTHRPNLTTFRYQMKEPISLLKSVDGMIVMSRFEEKQTQLIQYLFLDGKYGPMETFSPSKIWSDNVRDVLSANLGIKFRAENPAWTRDQLKATIEKHIDAKIIEVCIEARKFFPGVKAE